MKTTDKVLLSSILGTIYWTKFTPKQEKVILGIIADEELITSLRKASEICDFLNIERRSNRAVIDNILSKFLKD